MILVATITFGHHAQDVLAALEPAIRLAHERSDVEIVAVDDASGQELATIPAIQWTSTPSRRGFAGVVNFIVSELAPECDRLVLVNPDAVVSFEAMRDLCDSASEAEVVRILDDTGRLENVRPVLNPGRLVVALLFRHSWLSRGLRSSSCVASSVLCPPFAPAGTVISLDAELLRDLPLDDVMFWVEFSDWVRRASSRGRPISLSVSTHIAGHRGASTQASFPVSVSASQFRAYYEYIHRYGTPVARILAPLALALRSVRLAMRWRDLGAAWFVFQAALGRVDWRIQR